MIAGDHQWADAGALRAGDRVARLLARGVDHANQPGENEILLEVLAGLRRGIFRQVPRGDTERPECL